MEIWSASNTLLWIGASLVVTVIVHYIMTTVFYIIMSFWNLRHFSGPKPPSFLVGHFYGDMLSNKNVQRLRKWGNDHSPVFKLRVGFIRSFLAVCHPDAVKPLLVKNDPKEAWIYPMLQPWLGGSILVTHGKKWQRSRKLLTPAFHLDILRSYVAVYNQCTQLLINNWSSKDGKIVDIYADMKRLTFDILMRCIFSIDTKVLSAEGKDQPYLEAVEELGLIISKRSSSALLSIPIVFELIYGRKFRRLCNQVHDYSMNVIVERKAQLQREKLKQLQTHHHNKNQNLDQNHDQNQNQSESEPAPAPEPDTTNNTQHNTNANTNANANGHSADYDTPTLSSRAKKIDFIDILITSMHEDGTPVENEEIRPEVDMFMFAGHDTTSSGLTWTLFHLATRQDIQQKCRDEVLQVLRDSTEVAYADINSFPYLTQCIKESLRLCPPVPYIGRELIEPLELPDGRTVPVGTSVFCPISLLHHNAALWPNPDVYDPSRFEPQACNDRPPHAYVPFSSGPRNCIGQAFAMNVMKVAVALLLSKYTFAVDVSRDFQFQHDIIMRPRDGLHLLIKPVEV